MATNIEILDSIANLKESTDQVLELAKQNDRALRGANGSVGIIARVKSIEDKIIERDADQDKKLDRQVKIFYGTGASVISAIIVDIAIRYINT